MMALRTCSDPNDCKELLLVLTKGRTDFTVIDLVRFLLRDADKVKCPSFRLHACVSRAHARTHP